MQCKSDALYLAWLAEGGVGVGVWFNMEHLAEEKS